MDPFFAYLIKSSISMAVLYCLFRFIMRNDRTHALNRFLLLGILLVSAIIPFLNIQFFYEEASIKQVEVFREFVSAPVSTLAVSTEKAEPVIEPGGFSINLWLTFYLAVIVALLFRMVFGVYRVTQIIKQAEKRRLQKIILAVVKDLIQPFTFLNKIILSEKDFTENKDIVVTHEHAHIKQMHAIDLMLCELFTIVHFFNPFMWLLRRDLKLIHEFQADQAVLNKGIDAKKYQLLVLEKSVGERRFALANHFTQKPILKRLLMMRRTNQKRWAGVKLILFVPILIMLLQAFARPELITMVDEFIPVKYTENEIEKWLSKWSVDKISKGYYSPDIQDKNAPRKSNNVLVILMNRKDEYLIENQHKHKAELKQIVKDFLYGKNPDGKNGPDYAEKEIPFIGKMKVSKGVISYKHDLASSKEMVNFTLRAIGEACFEVRNDKAQVLFGKDYFDLETEKQEAVDSAVPVWFSYEYPKGPEPSVWLPFERKYSTKPKPFSIHFKDNGEILAEDHKFKSLDDFFESLTNWGMELEKYNEGRRSKANYRANIYIEYDMPDETWRNIQKAFYGNNIQIAGYNRTNSGVKTVLWSKKKKSSRRPFVAPIETEYRDTSVLYVSLFNDEEIDLPEIRKNAKECLDTKKSALIEFEKGITEKEIQSVKKVLKKSGFDEIEQIEVNDLREKSKTVQTNYNTSPLPAQKTETVQNNIPSVRVLEKWTFVNGSSCELNNISSALKDLLPDDETGRKVKFVVYPSVSKERVNQIYAGLSNLHDVEIIREDYTPPPPPPPKLVLHLYSDKIIYTGKRTVYGGREIKLDEVSAFTEQWIKNAGIKYSYNIMVHGAVSEERIDQVRTAMINGGAI